MDERIQVDEYPDGSWCAWFLSPIDGWKCHYTAPNRADAEKYAAHALKGEIARLDDGPVKQDGGFLEALFAENQAER